MSDVAAVVLAGGLSKRMGADKAFVPLGGRPLIARVIDRLERQVGRVYVNVGAPDARVLALARPLALDASEWRGAGPLAGIASALALARVEGFAFLATAPCDAPFLPLDLVARLRAGIAAGEGPAAAAVDMFGLQPMFALWPTDCGARVEAALATGRASPRGVLAEIGAAWVRFEPREGADPFANLNAPEDLARAEAALGSAARSQKLRPRSLPSGG